MIRTAAQLAASVQAFIDRSIRPNLAVKDLDALAYRAILAGGGVPAMKGYRGYSATTCISIDDELVNAPPDDRILTEGSLVKVVVAVIIKGWYAQTATSTIVGESEPRIQRLRSATLAALQAGIAAAKPGQRIGDIGTAIAGVLESAGYSAARDFVGHGIGRKLHEELGGIAAHFKHTVAIGDAAPEILSANPG